MPNPVLKKLLLKPGQKALILNAPQGYTVKLGEMPPGVELTEWPSTQADWVLLFVKDMKELEALAPKAVKAAKTDGLIWICYPKGGTKAKTDINRDTLWAAMGKHGLAGVSLVSLDEVWSAMRLRPADKVGK